LERFKLCQPLPPVPGFPRALSTINWSDSHRSI